MRVFRIIVAAVLAATAVLFGLLAAAVISMTAAGAILVRSLRRRFPLSSPDTRPRPTIPSPMDKRDAIDISATEVS